MVAEVTAISDQVFKTLENVTRQEPARVLLNMPLKHWDSLMVPFKLISKPPQRLLSLYLDYSVSSLEQTIREKFPKVFQGLGTLGAPYTIKLKEGAKSYILYGPRNILFALHDKVQDKLHTMESMGVIKKITEPSEWCAGIVIVPKSTGAVRICVDLKPLNTSVLREPHPIPTVNETLAQLSGATTFSKSMPEFVKSS